MGAVKIEAFTFDYDELEDRIRLSGNLYNGAPEISFWLTRRLSLRLLNASVDLIQKTSPTVANAPLEHRSAMALFEHESAQVEAKIDTTLNAAPKYLTTNVEILRRLDISFVEQHYKLSFFFKDNDMPAAVSILSHSQLHQTLFLIHKGADALEWGVDKQLFSLPEATKPTLQ